MYRTGSEVFSDESRSCSKTGMPEKHTPTLSRQAATLLYCSLFDGAAATGRAIKATGFAKQ